MAAQRWVGQAFINSNVGEVTVEVYASTYPGAVQQVRAKYGDYQSLWNLTAVSSPGGGGSTSRGGAGSGCLALVGLFFLIIIAAASGGSSGSDDTEPTETLQNAPVERVEFSPQKSTPSYANPPGPCVTANFEPC